MGLRSHLKQHWVTWLASAIFFSPSVYFYLQTREVRDPVFLVDPVRTEIISRARVETAPIRVLRQDGRAVTGDVYALRFYLWNAGRRSIRSADVLDTIRIRFDESSAEILDFKILTRSRPITATQLHPLRAERQPSALVVSFLILERNDGFTGQIIYQGPNDAPLRVSGTIEGALAGIRDGSALTLLGVLRYSTGKVSLPFFLAIMTGFAAYILMLLRRDRRQREAASIPPGRWSRLSGWIAGAIITFFALLVAFGIVSDYDKWQAEARTRIVTSVPRGVQP